MSKAGTRSMLLKGFRVGMAVVLAAGLSVPTAFAAADGDLLAAESAALKAEVSTQAATTWVAPASATPASKIVEDNVVTVGGHGTATALPDMLGLNGTTIPKALVASKTSAQAAKVNRLGVYGSAANENPNPFMANTFYNLVSTSTGSKGNWAAAEITPASTSEDAFNSELEDGLGVPADLAYRPDIVIGIGGASGNLLGVELTYNASTSTWSNYSSWQGGQARLYPLNIRRWTADSSLAGKKNSDGNVYMLSEYYREGDEAYDPIGMSYRAASGINTAVENANDLAYDAKLAMQQHAGKSTRYGDPLTIANDLERYAKATKWYVLSKIADNTVAKKRIAVVSRVKDGSFELIKLNPDGDAADFGSMYRIAEAAQDTVIDLAGELDSNGVSKPGTVSSPVKASASQLAGVDTVICMPEWTSSYDSSASAVRSALRNAGISDNAMPAIFDWVIPLGTLESAVAFSASEESVLLSGLVQGFVYPEVVDSVDWLTYFASRMYHLKAESLKQFVSDQLEGVSLAGGASTNDDAHYSDAALRAVSDKLEMGTTYYYGHKADIDEARPKIASSDALDDAYGIDVHQVAITVPDGASATVYDERGLIVEKVNNAYTLDATADSLLEVSLSGYRTYTRTIGGGESGVVVGTSDMTRVRRVAVDIPSGASVQVRNANNRTLSAEADGSYLIDEGATASFTVTLAGYEPYSRALSASATAIKVNASKMTRSTVRCSITIPDGASMVVKDSGGAEIPSNSDDAYSLKYGLSYTLLVDLEGYDTYKRAIKPGANTYFTVYKKDMKLSKGKTKLTINKATVTAGDISAADALNVNSIVFGPKVKSIGEGVCANFPNLKTVTLGKNVTAIGKGAFLGCNKLTSVAFGAKIIDVGESAFSGCAKLAGVTLGDKVKSIGRRAFANCSSLKSLAIPAATKTIGTYSFSGCKKLTSLTVKSKKLTKAGVFGSLANSSVKTVKVSVGKAAANKTYVKKYKTIFTQSNSGRAVTVK